MISQVVEEELLALLRQKLPSRAPDWQFWLLVATIIATSAVTLYRMDAMEHRAEAIENNLGAYKLSVAKELKLVNANMVRHLQDELAQQLADQREELATLKAGMKKTGHRKGS